MVKLAKCCLNCREENFKCKSDKLSNCSGDSCSLSWVYGRMIHLQQELLCKLVSTCDVSVWSVRGHSRIEEQA